VKGKVFVQSVPRHRARSFRFPLRRSSHSRGEAVLSPDAPLGCLAAGRTVSLWLKPEAQVGDYVYVHTGYVISVVDEAEALESLRLLQELVDTYPVDELFRTTGDLSPSAAGLPGL
jgi:hydrogenase assembly chaperone HypC/HupF